VRAIPLPRAPFHFSEGPVEMPNHLALLGQDNDQVLEKYLGYSKEKVEGLIRLGLLVRDPQLARLH
jgi:crotonobetainyl-CoA:carnitine CoA-transferase CaiB-like acyl-CoA transferase